MCGRIACTLGDNLGEAAGYKSKKSKCYCKAKWLNKFVPFKAAFNAPPTTSLPVMVSSEQCLSASSETERLIILMRFGIIPSWVREENFKPNQLELHLCRTETANSSKLYKPLLEKGNRCVIPCTGYYEWQSTNASKQPYFFYNKENTVTDLTRTEGSFSSENGWDGIKLLYLAGIFNTYINKQGEEAYSFAILTKETCEEWKWVHHRMPVVLQSEEDVNVWLHSKTYPLSVAHELWKKNIENLSAHPVDKSVINNTRNNVSKCVEPISLEKPESSVLKNWLQNAQHGSKSDKKNTQQNKPAEKKRTLLDNWLTPPNKKMKNE